MFEKKLIKRLDKAKKIWYNITGKEYSEMVLKNCENCVYFRKILFFLGKCDKNNNFTFSWNFCEKYKMVGWLKSEVGEYGKKVKKAVK